MRRISLLIICLIMTLNVCMPVVSAETVDRGMLYMVEWYDRYSEELETVGKTVAAGNSEWDEYLGTDREDVVYSLMYQVYYLDMKSIVGAYDRDGSFAENISDKYYWVVCNEENGKEVEVVHSEQGEYGWALRRGTDYHAEMKRNYPEVEFDTVSMYNKVFEEFPEADDTSFRFVKEDSQNILILFFTSGGTEYVVPYYTSPDINWITNATVYEASEFVDLMRVNSSDDSAFASVTEPGATTEVIYLNYVVIGTVAVILIAAIAFVTARFKKKK